MDLYNHIMKKDILALQQEICLENILREKSKESSRILSNESSHYIESFIEDYKTNVNPYDLGERSSLIDAIMREDEDSVTYLVDKGIDINLKDERSYTALMWSSLLGFQDLTILLLDSGANVFDTDKCGNTPLMLATGYFDITETLLQYGSDINASNHNEFTTLMWNCGDIDIVKLLVSKGARINDTNIEGKTPFILASEHGNLEVVKYLISEGADIEKKSDTGFTALMGAANMGKLHVVKYLVEELKLDPNVTDDFGKTSCMWAINTFQTEVAIYLSNLK